MAKKFQAKPPRIEAVQFTGGANSDAETFAAGKVTYEADDDRLVLETAFGPQAVAKGDWVCTDDHTDGFYGVSDADLVAKYDEVK